jgi:hypothetical protein
MRIKAIAFVAVAIVLSGCYRVTVMTGAPTSMQTIDKPWQMSFVLGLVPPPELTTTPQCAQGIGQVMTERSFLNGLVGQLSSGLITPMRVKVTCASGPVSR